MARHPAKHVDKINGEWREVDANERLVMKDYGERLDAERRRKRDAILEILFEEAANGRCYTANQFAESFEGKAGLGGERTIRERISALSTQGYIKYFRNAADYGLPSSGRTKFGYLCVEGMVLRMPAGDADHGHRRGADARAHGAAHPLQVPAFRRGHAGREPRRVGLPRRTERSGAP
jgi:putative DNA primase/helicase